MLTPEQEARLTGGGDCPDHYHSSDKRMDLSSLQELQALEVVITVSGDIDLQTDTSVTASQVASFIRCEASSPLEVKLRKARGTGQKVTISRVSGSSVVSVLAQSGDTINGVSSVSISSSYAPRRFKDMGPNIWEEI